jgi:exodeoxyribonuclease-5
VKAGNPQNKIIFLGDRNQLPPINENDSMALIPKYLEEMYSLKGSIQFLTVVKRQEDGSNIMQNAVNTRVAIESGKQNAAISAYKFNSIFTAAKHYVKDYRTNAPEFCISINPFHKGNQLFNRVVRENLYGNRVRTIEVGDWMLITQKWCRNGLELFNGDHVIVEAFDPNVIENVAGLFFSPIRLKAKNLAGVEVMIDDYVLIDSIQHPNGSLPIEQEKMLRGERYRKNPVYRNSGFMSDDKYVGAIRLTYGYSITCHKAQGGEWSKVYMSTFHIPSLKYQYTAITRAVDQLVIY